MLTLNLTLVLTLVLILIITLTLMLILILTLTLMRRVDVETWSIYRRQNNVDLSASIYRRRFDLRFWTSDRCRFDAKSTSNCPLHGCSHSSSNMKRLGSLGTFPLRIILKFYMFMQKRDFPQFRGRTSMIGFDTLKINYYPRSSAIKRDFIKITKLQNLLVELLNYLICLIFLYGFQLELYFLIRIPRVHIKPTNCSIIWKRRCKGWKSHKELSLILNFSGYVTEGSERRCLTPSSLTLCTCTLSYKNNFKS